MTIARVTEITSQSPEGFDRAIEHGIARASKSIERIQSAWIKDQELVIESGKPKLYRVTMKLTYVVEQ